MQIEILLTILLLFVLSLLATVDMAFSQLTDVGLRRLISEAEEHPTPRSSFLRQVLENAAFSFTHSAAIQDLTRRGCCFSSPDLTEALFKYQVRAGRLAIGLILAGIFRQLIPLLLSHRVPKPLFVLAAAIRPFSE